MAMEKCIQVSTVCSNARVSGLFSSKERPHLQTFIRAPPAMRLLNSTLSFSSSSSGPHSLSRRCANSRIVCKSSVGEVEAVTDSSWNEKVVGSTTPVLVEFWAPWCGPCRMIAPVVDELAKEYSGKVSCYKVNTDDCPDIASRYGIRSIPTVLFFKNGEKKESVIGAVPKSTLTATLDKYLDI